MQLTPAYGDRPLIELDGDPAAIAGPLVRQRSRLTEVLAGLDDEQWAHPTRCDGWSCRDVITHLHTTNQFWSFSVTMGLKGQPTEFLTTFDPVASPVQFVADAPPTTPSELVDQFAASNDVLVDQLRGLDDDAWRTTAEAPIGHVTISTLAHHALWDSLVHERDILLPLGLAPAEEPDEVLASLRFVAALSPAFALTRGPVPGGAVGVEPSDAEGAFTVTVTDRVAVTAGTASPDLALTGTAIGLLEALSLRAPLDQPVPASSAWFFDGLKVTFDQAPA